jgi:sarcosine oxidase subunit alpha
MSSRLDGISGEWIDRSRSIRFEFEGRGFEGYSGDCVSSALWAAGAHTVGRSFKYHRRRGVLSLANHDINGMMQDGPYLNERADVTPLREGMRLTAVNTWGGIAADRGRWLDKLSLFLPVGFYYKAFHSPRRLFPYWERLIRNMTGLGHIEPSTPRQLTPKRYDFTDLLIVGGGASGLAAALAAGRAGLQVVVVDENARAGGSLGYNRAGDDASLQRCEQLITDLAALPNVEIRTDTYAAGYYADHWVPLIDRGRMTKMRCRAIIVAAGAYEQPAVFRNNDLPGIMLASAAQRLIYRYAVKPVTSAVILAANSDAYRAALDLHRNGIRVVAVLDLRPQGEASELRDRVAKAGISIRRSYCVYEAVPNRDGHLAAAVVCPLNAAGEPDPAQRETLQCDGLLMSTGWAPAAPLLYQAGTRMRYDDSVEQFVPDVLPPGVFAAGRVNGIHQPESKMLDGERAAHAAMAYLGIAGDRDVTVPPEAVSPSHPFPVFGHPKAKNFVDYDEDLQLKDFFNAVQEGYDNIELMKRYTTVGMGPSQGKHSNMNAIRILSRATGRPIAEVGTTTARPFFHPVPLGHLAGRGFHPERVTALQHRHTEAGAVFMPAGAWLRPEYYARSGLSKRECVLNEVAAVRTGVGLIDVGTLGKIEISGPDAGAFLERVYTGRYGNMKNGTTRYCLMVDESGVIIDDGVVGRVSEHCFYFTTTTSNSAAIYREMTRLNTMWRMECGIVNLTGAMCSVNLAGPKAREVLAPLADFDVSAATFPYLALREGRVANVQARVMRVGFVGELGYEIHVPSEYAQHVWDSLMKTGDSQGIRPFGVEAQRLLRLEKGHIIIGQDTDGLTTPFDAGMGPLAKMDKPFFIGQRSLRIITNKPRKQALVGFRLEKSDGRLPKECHLVIVNGEIGGRVTSVGFSPSVGAVVGLAYVPLPKKAPGSRFTIRVDGGELLWATVIATPFYDPANERQRL